MNLIEKYCNILLYDKLDVKDTTATPQDNQNSWVYTTCGDVYFVICTCPVRLWHAHASYLQELNHKSRTREKAVPNQDEQPKQLWPILKKEICGSNKTDLSVWRLGRRRASFDYTPPGHLHSQVPAGVSIGQASCSVIGISGGRKVRKLE